MSFFFLPGPVSDFDISRLINSAESYFSLRPCGPKEYLTGYFSIRHIASHAKLIASTASGCMPKTSVDVMARSASISERRFIMSGLCAPPPHIRISRVLFSILFDGIADGSRCQLK